MPDESGCDFSYSAIVPQLAPPFPLQFCKPGYLFHCLSKTCSAEGEQRSFFLKSASAAALPGTAAATAATAAVLDILMFLPDHEKRIQNNQKNNHNSCYHIFILSQPTKSLPI